MSTSARRILVAEDVEVTALVAARVLSRRGFEVEVSEDGQDCLEKLSTFAPQLVILDLMLPKVDGINVLKQIRSDPDSEIRKVGVILYTAELFRPDVSLARELGVFDAVEKSAGIGRLLSSVEEYFAAGGKFPGSQEESASGKPGVAEVYDLPAEAARGTACLWGTRGSIPICGPLYMRHGGNTSCMAITYDENILIFDAGSGIRDLSGALFQPPRRICVFITHAHWDHIQGFPFFTPAYDPTCEIEIFGSRGFGKDLESIFRGQLDRDYFPVQLDDMNATLQFKQLDEEAIEVGRATVTWTYAHHPGATVCYKIDIDGKTVVWMPDNEFLSGYFGSPLEVTLDSDIVAPYRPLLAFLDEVDVLISEAQYMNSEYPEKLRWGHSSVSNACLLTKLARVKKWIVTHHDPTHDDRFLDRKLVVTKKLLQQLDCPAEVVHGYDGFVEYL